MLEGNTNKRLMVLSLGSEVISHYYFLIFLSICALFNCFMISSYSNYNKAKHNYLITEVNYIFPRSGGNQWSE